MLEQEILGSKTSGGGAKTSGGGGGGGHGRFSAAAILAR